MRTPEEEPGPVTDSLKIKLRYSTTESSIDSNIPDVGHDRSDTSPSSKAAGNSDHPSSMPSLPVPNSTISYWHTTHPNSLVNHRTTPKLPETATIVIIGSGISGAFAAKELTSYGIRNILVLEAREICSGATGRNGGHCQPLCYDQLPEVGEFELRNIAYLSNLIKSQDIQCDWSQFAEGGCHAYYSVELFEEVKGKIAAMETECPNLAKLIQVVEDPERLTCLKVPGAVGAVLQANAAALHPYKLVTHVWGALIGTGTVNLQTTTPVTRITANSSASNGCDRWIVHTTRGTVSTSQILLTTNAYTAHLLPQFDCLIVPVQGQMSALVPPTHALQHPLQHDYGFCGIMEQDPDEDEYLVQRPASTGGEFMFGGGRAVAKNDAVGVSDDSYVDERVRRYLRKMLPKLMDVYGTCERGETKMDSLPARYAIIEQGHNTRGLTPIAEWTGIMGYSRDGHPWVGGVPGMDGVWLCAGYTGHGMPNGSLCARHVASLIASGMKGEGKEGEDGHEDWKEVEREAVRQNTIPACYVISEERMRAAREMPEVNGKGTDGNLVKD